MVPKGWRLGRVGDLANTTMGYAFKSRDFTASGTPLLRMGNLYQSSLDFGRNSVYLPDSFKIEYLRFLVSRGDLVMSMTGTMGKRDYGFTVKIPRDAPDSLLNQRVMKLIPKNGTSVGYLLSLLRSEIILSRLYSLPGGTKQANLSAQQVQNLPAPVPPLPEQRKIAKILQTWDRAIATTEKLIDASKQQKNALMQQLLTGKKRFAGFEGEWESVQLLKIADIAMGSSPKSSAYNDVQDGLPILQGNSDIKRRRSCPRIYSSEITRECQVGDILLSVRAPVGAVAKSQHHACIGRGIAAISAKKEYSQEYLYQLMLWFEPQWKGLSQGSTFEAVNSNDIKSLPLTIPTLCEQQKIAAALKISDHEIELLEEKHRHLKQEEKSLMQLLLTGKRRVKVDE